MVNAQSPARLLQRDCAAAASLDNRPIQLAQLHLRTCVRAVEPGMISIPLRPNNKGLDQYIHECPPMFGPNELNGPAAMSSQAIRVSGLRLEIAFLHCRSIRKSRMLNTAHNACRQYKDLASIAPSLMQMGTALAGSHTSAGSLNSTSSTSPLSGSRAVPSFLKVGGTTELQ